MSYLLVSNEDPVDLDGYIDSAGSLQIKHDSDNLVDYDQEIWCTHATSDSIVVKIFDFVDGATTWVVSAEHGRTSWTRESNHVWFEFTEPYSTPLDVTVTATAGTTKQRTIKVKPQPHESGLLLQSPAESVL